MKRQGLGGLTLNSDASTGAPGFGRHARTKGWRRWLPGLALLERYNFSLFTQDLVAGLVLTAILAPVGMGYAEAAGLPAAYGLYATMIPLFVYALIGPSRILVLGPDSALIALIAATVLPMADGDAGRAVVLASVLALLTGAISILAGVARFGFVTDLLSKPIRYGYLNGVALTLLIGQLPKILGFKVEGSSLLEEAAGLVKGIQAGQINWASSALGLFCLTVIFGFKFFMPRFPGVLAAVVASTLLVSVFDLSELAHVSVIGSLPQGLPALVFPQIGIDQLMHLLAGAVAISLVSITDMSVLSRIYALRGGYYVDDNQELVALGLANLATGLFQGFSVSSSASRTPVAEAAGAKTQMTCVVGAVCLGLLLIFAPGLMQNVPTAALGTVVIAACVTIFEFREVIRLFKLRRGEFYLSIICFLGVALMGVIQGIFIAVAIALLIFIWRAWRPYNAVLGRVDGMKGYHDIKRHPEARRIPGLVLFRWDAPLFFANAEMFREQVLRSISEAPTPTSWVVVAAEPVTDVDITAADVLAELSEELGRSGIQLCFAVMKGPVKDHLKRYGLYSKLGEQHFFSTIGQSVDRYLSTHQVDWIDWEDMEQMKRAPGSCWPD